MKSKSPIEKLLRNNKISVYPSKQATKIKVLEYIVGNISHSTVFNEKQINNLIIKLVDNADFALIRRDLVDYGYLERDKSCSKYIVSKT